jgi:hypothetical protein
MASSAAAAPAAAPAGAEIKQGIDVTDRPQIKKHLTKLAFSDLHHDFGSSYIDELLEALPMSSKIDSVTLKANVREISAGIAKKQGAKSTKRWNLYDELAGHMLKILPEGLGMTVDDAKTAWMAEEMVIRPYGINLSAIKTSLVNRELDDLYTPFVLSESQTITIPNNASTNEEVTPQFTRNYNITAMPYKIGELNIPLGAVFEKVTGSKEFTMVIDAGNLPLTELAKVNNDPGDNRKDKLTMIEESDFSKLEISKNQEYTFRILESIENTSDPAGKVKNFKKYSDSKVTILRYKDEGHSSTFSNFNDPTQNANFFSSADFITSYTENGDVKATFTLDPSKKNVTHTIDNLGNDSEIGRAATLSIIKYVENYPDINKKSPDIDKIREVVLYPMMKRAGDWCQALCLLDTVRKYNVIERISSTKEKAGDKAQITLDSVKGTSSIGLMTHDQILLAYSLLIGVNVYFTLSTANVSGERVSWLVFFKNLDTATFDGNIEDTKSTLSTKMAALQALIAAERERQAVKKGALEDNLTPFKSERTSETVKEAKEYLYKLYSYMRIKQGIVNFDESLDDEVAKLNEMIGELSTVNGYKVIMEVETYIKNIETLIANNANQYALIENITWPATEVSGKVPFNDEYEIISNVFQDIANGKNIASLNNYKQLTQEVYIPIKNYLDKMKFSTYKPPVKIENTIPSEPGKRAPRIAGITENNRRISGDIDELFSAHIPMTGGVQFIEHEDEDPNDRNKRISEILKDSFYKIRSNLVVPYWPVGAAKKLGFKESRQIQPKSVKTTAEHYLAPISNYVVDNHGNYYSVLDKYIVTIDDCYKFISIYGDECDFLKIRPFSKHLNSTKHSQDVGKRIIDDIFRDLKSITHSTEIFINEYLNLRMCLLMHDILYTNLLNLVYRYNSLTGEESEKLSDESIREELNEFNSDLTILKNKLSSIGIIVGSATTRKAANISILEQYKSTLFEIRKSIFTSYYITNRGKGLYKKLNQYEIKEVEDYKATLTVKEDLTSFENLIINDTKSKDNDINAIGPREEEPKDIEEKGGAGSGGRRITRRRKDKKRKATRKRTTRRRV